MEKRSLLERMDAVLLVMDEIVDGGCGGRKREERAGEGRREEKEGGGGDESKELGGREI